MSDWKSRLEQSLRWHFAAHAAEPDGTYGSLGIENAILIAESAIDEETAHLHVEARRWIRLMGETIGGVREFAEGIIAYEDEHAHGPDTPLRLALANDLLAILQGE